MSRAKWENVNICTHMHRKPLYRIFIIIGRQCWLFQSKMSSIKTEPKLMHFCWRSFYLFNCKFYYLNPTGTCAYVSNWRFLCMFLRWNYAISMNVGERKGYKTILYEWMETDPKTPWNMMTSSNGNIFRVTGPLCEEFTGHRWIPHTKAGDVELWCFLWSVPE